MVDRAPLEGFPCRPLVFIIMKNTRIRNTLQITDVEKENLSPFTENTLEICFAVTMEVIHCYVKRKEHFFQLGRTLLQTINKNA